MRRISLLVLVTVLAAPLAVAGIGVETPEVDNQKPAEEAPAPEAPAQDLKIAEAPDQTPAKSLDEIRELADPNQDGLFHALRRCESAAEFAQCPGCSGCIVSNNIVYCYGC